MSYTKGQLKNKIRQESKVIEARSWFFEEWGIYMVIGSGIIVIASMILRVM